MFDVRFSTSGVLVDKVVVEWYNYPGYKDGDYLEIYGSESAVLDASATRISRVLMDVSAVSETAGL